MIKKISNIAPFGLRIPEDFFEEAQTIGSYLNVPFRSIKQLAHYDCALKQSITVQEIYYEGDLGAGKTQKVMTYKFDENGMKDIAPGTVEDEVFNFVCKIPKKKIAPSTSVWLPTAN